jgi:hypothetical protein
LPAFFYVHRNRIAPNAKRVGAHARVFRAIAFLKCGKIPTVARVLRAARAASVREKIHAVQRVPAVIDVLRTRRAPAAAPAWPFGASMAAIAAHFVDKIARASAAKARFQISRDAFDASAM